MIGINDGAVPKLTFSFGKAPFIKSQPSQLSQPFSTRGLRTHRYHCIALRALMKSQPSKPSQPSQPFLYIHFAFSTKE